MKKLYRKGVVHPTPPVVSDHLLYLLPAAVLTLTAALSPEDREVLAYLISCSSSNYSNNHRQTTQKTAASAGKVSADHPACFNCYCFRCYTSYWVKWDLSPNRQLIHEIIDDFEDRLLKESKKEKNNKEESKKEKNNKEKSKKEKNQKEKNKVKGKISKEKSSIELDEPKKSELSLTQQDTDLGEPAAMVGGEEVEVEDNVEEAELEKGSIRRFMSFIGERIWGVWG